MTVATLCANDKLLPVVAQLPIAEQERFTSPGTMIEVEYTNPRYGKANEPEFVTKRYMPYLIPNDVVKQLFDMEAKSLRDKASQQAYIRSRKGKKEKVDKARQPRLRVDPELMLVLVDNKPVKIAALANAVARLVEDRPEVKEIFWKAFRSAKATV